MSRKILGLFIIGLFLAGPSASAGEAQEAYSFDENHKLQPGDKIKITIYPMDEHLKGGEMQVSPEGNITLSLVGKYHIVGKTVLNASRELVEIIDKDYLVDPEVVIETLALRVTKVPVSVLGAVKKPGNYEVTTKGKSVTLLQAILYAGGFSDVANIKKIKIIRKGAGANESIHVNAENVISGNQEDIKLEDEDIIHVAESLF